MGTLNLGIVAHVDAGKTTLTERLLHAAGAIDEVGRVDEGTTQTDSLALERQRGITIRAAVVAFTVDDVTVNVIDTPGHPDFIAEVDRALHVLDGAVLLVSAVEGVQAQTMVLMRALRRLHVPTLLFVNKIDRPGADAERVLASIRDRLSPHAIPMGTIAAPGTPTASFVPLAWDDRTARDGVMHVLADQDDELLATVVGDHVVSADDLWSQLVAATARARVHPVFFGSAITGAGVPALMAALPRLLPTADGDPDGALFGRVFKVERRPRGRKVAYVRLFDGTVHLRDRLQVGRRHEATVTGLTVFEHGAAVDRTAASVGQIALMSGLGEVQVGDTVDCIGPADPSVRSSPPNSFSPPTLETAVVASDPRQRAALHAALAELAEQDPLIDLRQDDERGELFVSLYGEVQKEVIEQTLAADFGIGIEFRPTSTICVERPIGTGRARERLGRGGNPFLATIGLTLEPGPVGGGLAFRLAVPVGTIPLYVYKTVDAFERAMDDHVRSTLRQGLFGWEVTDCLVTMTDCGYTAPGTKAGDFRKLSPLVVMAALRRAATVVCEPIHRFHLEAPAESLPSVLRLLSQLRAVPRLPKLTGSRAMLDGDIPAAEVHRLQQRLGGLTRGEGFVEAELDRYEPAIGSAPVRPRSDHNPLDRRAYLRHVLGRI